MENQKTYSLQKALRYAVIVSLGFVLLTWLLSLTLERFQSILLPDAGAAWYYWKLPHPEIWASITMWVLYAAHQALVWGLVYRLKHQPSVPSGRIGRVNFWLLVVNAVFIALHLLQTTLFYDGLAQYVPVMSSQGSVIVMLVMILILMNRQRGLFFGKRAKLPAQGVALVGKTHGYYIAWAVIYTFWFHPMEGTWGHLLGFFYLFMLMTQLSLARTGWHTRIGWVTFLEAFVAIHGAVVAMQAGNGMWPMFFFGFLMMFVVTQMFGVVTHKVARAGIAASYTCLVLLTYGGVFRNLFTGTSVGWASIHQITWIPVILYGLVFVLAWLLQGFAALQKRAFPKTSKQ